MPSKSNKQKNLQNQTANRLSMVNKKRHHNKIFWACIGNGNFQFTSLEKTGETGKDKKNFVYFPPCQVLQGQLCEN
jgi:hypothetical protein